MRTPHPASRLPHPASRDFQKFAWKIRLPHPASRDFQKFAWKIREYLGTAGCEMHIVLYANPTPARTVDSRFDRHHRAGAQRRFDGFRQPGRFVDFQPETVAEAVAKRVAISAVLDVASSEAICLLTFHPGADRARSDSIGVTHDVEE